MAFTAYPAHLKYKRDTKKLEPDTTIMTMKPDFHADAGLAHGYHHYFLTTAPF